ncbi:hypothetical protein DFQ30_000317 [Apophysomyces sp. BC1015]|nr:hypothetical protein DFQ30_000317 [Apophysomyces sp. BC1015]
MRIPLIPQEIMRGADKFTESLFCVRKLDDLVPASHPLRSIRAMVNETLAKMDRLFAGMYEADVKGSKRGNETHQSKIDPDARLYRKGKTGSELRYMGHTLSDNRHGLVVNARLTCADGHAEREAAKVMINDARQAADDEDVEITLGADKGYDAKECIEACQEMKVAPHVAQNTSGRGSAVADAIARSVGHAISQQKRKLIEQGFGWVKTVGRMRQVMVHGLEKVDQMFVLNMAAYHLVRMRSLGQVRP